jgi:hypothetical protein
MNHMRTVLEQAKSWHRPLMLMVLAMTGLVVASGIGLAVDNREILNESVWLKPFKSASPSSCTARRWPGCG